MVKSVLEVTVLAETEKTMDIIVKLSNGSNCPIVLKS